MIEIASHGSGIGHVCDGGLDSSDEKSEKVSAR